MAIKPVRVPTLGQAVPIVDDQGNPTAQFVQIWNNALTQIVASLNQVTAAQSAATSANAAAASANTAAASANTVATTISSAQQLGTSYVSGAVLTATDAGANATVTVGAHSRYYPQNNGTVTIVAVNTGTVTGLAYSTKYFIYYGDPARTGGAVTYAATTSAAAAAQIGNRHIVGAVTTPAAAGAAITGAYTRPPGSGAISLL